MGRFLMPWWTPVPYRYSIEYQQVPRLLSLRRADVAGLTISGVDLQACRFADAHHLDQLRVEDSNFAATSPRGWRWTTRQTIADEHHWRAEQATKHEREAGWAEGEGRRATAKREARRAKAANAWYGPPHKPPSWLELDPFRAAGPSMIAGLYRALRKGREDNKDEPGGADFYYGEMEMRRHDTLKPRVERLVLWLYWLVSGYGLRAWRALAAVAVVIGLFGVGFSRVGFHHPHPSQAVSWLYALQATVSLEGKAHQLSGQLTLPGELLRVGLRLTGPVLLGLALLSIRGRVKR